MKYYIIRPKCSKKDKKIIFGLREMDPDAVITDSIEECDIAILQRNWTRSKHALVMKEQADMLHKPCKEAYLYTDRYKAVTT